MLSLPSSSRLCCVCGAVAALLLLPGTASAGIYWTTGNLSSNTPADCPPSVTHGWSTFPGEQCSKGGTWTTNTVTKNSGSTVWIGFLAADTGFMNQSTSLSGNGTKTLTRNGSTPFPDAGVCWVPSATSANVKCVDAM